MTAATKPSTTKKPATANEVAPPRGKTVNKPRHTAPSKFDDVVDD